MASAYEIAIQSVLNPSIVGLAAMGAGASNVPHDKPHRGRLATSPRTALVTSAVRNQAPRYDPLNGEGGRIHGGRFNPPDSFPALYLWETRSCAIAELRRQGLRHVVGVEGLLPRVLYRYELDLQRVLDLTSAETPSTLE
jgi:RES domain-containing protein